MLRVITRTLLGLLLALALAASFTAAQAAMVGFEVGMLPEGAAAPESIVSGALDSRFESFDPRTVRNGEASVWLRLQRIAKPAATERAVVLKVQKPRRVHVQPFVLEAGRAAPLALAAFLPRFAGAQEAVFLTPSGASAAPIYVRVDARAGGLEQLTFTDGTLEETLSAANAHARMIAWTFGALMAMAISALLIWFVLADRLVLLYGAMFALQALYIAYLSGQGFDWPVFSLATPFTSYAWNVPAALSGACASLFVREIAELKRFSPRVYRFYGWLAVVFCALAFSNLAQHIGLHDVVVTIGNLVFLGSAVFTLVVLFLAWRRENRAAGWVLIAWGLLETFTIATAIRLLVGDADEAAVFLYYGLPLSMVAAAVLIALGVADRLRDQRIALTDAELRAQTDPLTGVLNRRSLIERLETACMRAQARGLPIGLLFIDLDHFKEINDTFGHAAGDACLRAIIEPIQAELRQSDVIGRYGGEEFVVILSSADAFAAEPIAERIRNRVADVRVEGFGAPIHLTCSIGVATSDRLGEWGEKLIARADEAVYAAKRSGRNRVQIAAPPLAA